MLPNRRFRRDCVCLLAHETADQVHLSRAQADFVVDLAVADDGLLHAAHIDALEDA